MTSLYPKNTSVQVLCRYNMSMKTNEALFRTLYNFLAVGLKK